MYIEGNDNNVTIYNNISYENSFNDHSTSNNYGGCASILTMLVLLPFFLILLGGLITLLGAWGIVFSLFLTAGIQTHYIFHLLVGAI